MGTLRKYLTKQVMKGLDEEHRPGSPACSDRTKVNTDNHFIPRNIDITHNINLGGKPIDESITNVTTSFLNKALETSFLLSTLSMAFYCFQKKERVLGWYQIMVLMGQLAKFPGFTESVRDALLENLTKIFKRQGVDMSTQT